MRLLALASLLLAGSSPAGPPEPSIQSVEVAARGHDLVLNADISLELNSQLQDAADRGLPLYFTAEVEISRPRWYWFDETVLTASQTWRIMHNPLTGQWRVSTGVLALPLGSLSEALSVVRHIRTWRIADRGVLRDDVDYEGRLRVRFDLSQLSKPFQVNALNSGDWSLTTQWASFPVRVAADAGAPPPARSPGAMGTTAEPQPRAPSPP
ncbi:DUF4390 domain-containing protein, partial [Pigmentiphaga soli]|uniref:DUF4390 domain-containing protein n=1 Tax=Pigmentiphaga soli TaxID=1007095 RepID=UPI0031EF757C